MKIVFATGNEDKMREIREILGDLGWKIQSRKEAGIDMDIAETGSSFEENALLKARAVASRCEDIVLADDSGLEIDALGGEPGIYSSRFAGEDASYETKIGILLDRLAGVPEEKRTARFVCAVAAIVPGHEPIVVRGTFEGRIGEAPAGENGFGYDPIFVVPERGCTSAELSPEEKNAMSHRGKALRRMREKLAEIADEREPEAAFSRGKSD